MRPDLPGLLEKAKPRGWKKVRMEFTGGPLTISVPKEGVELTMKKATALTNPAREIARILDEPLQSPHLEEIIAGKGKPAKDLIVAITISDITRPVPYRAPKGILPPLLKKLEIQGIEREHIRIIVGTGTHRASTAREKQDMLGKEIVSRYKILDHDCTDDANLVHIGRTATGTEVFLNRQFHEADLKIVTGLTESHFMAGASGGRKAVCPGLVDQRTIQKFHSPDFLESPAADNLVIEGNPCHEESLAVAKAAGVDFAITVTLDKDMRITGVFAGDLEKIFEAAVNKIKEYVTIPLGEEFDIVLTHGGYVGRNHYQVAKAAVGAIPVVKQGGVIIIAADNRDPEPIGGPEYKTLTHLLKLQGPDGYVDLLKAPSWRFTKDQWEPEMWGKVLRKVGEEGLIYCSADIPEEDFVLLPGVSGYEFLTPAGKRKSRALKVQEMVQNALIYYWSRLLGRGVTARVAFIREGPYAVPVKK